MGFPPDFDPDDPTEVAGGRRFPFHIVGDWVMLAIDPKTGKVLHAAARTLYSLLKMHANRDTAEAKPSTETLAEMMGVSRGDKVTPYLQALVRVGAIDIEVRRTGVNRMRKRNFYTVHEAPPDGYAGYLSLKEYYAARDGKTAGQAGPPENRGSGPGATSEDTTPEPPKTGCPETPKTGAPDNPKTGGPDTPKRGLELDQPGTTSTKKNYGEEEAARTRAGAGTSDQGKDQAADLPKPSMFALVTIRSIIEAAPQTKSTEDRPFPEVIGDPEVDALARRFDAEAERLAEHRPHTASADLAGWLRRGLASADSLWAILDHRLTPGAAVDAMVRKANKKTTPGKSRKRPSREVVPPTCTVHPGAEPGSCAECAEAEAHHRREAKERALRGAAQVREAMANSGSGSTT